MGLEAGTLKPKYQQVHAPFEGSREEYPHASSLLLADISNFWCPVASSVLTLLHLHVAFVLVYLCICVSESPSISLIKTQGIGFRPLLIQYDSS